jgi:hypothetical protein
MQQVVVAVYDFKTAQNDKIQKGILRNQARHIFGTYVIVFLLERGFFSEFFDIKYSFRPFSSCDSLLLRVRYYCNEKRYTTRK